MVCLARKGAQKRNEEANFSTRTQREAYGSRAREVRRTPVVQGRTDVNVRALRGTEVWKSRLDSVVSSDLFSQRGQDDVLSADRA